VIAESKKEPVLTSVISLLFDEALRPDAPAIYELAADSKEFMVSHDPRQVSDGNWLELLANGLTFDLRGLAPGNSEIFELHPHVFDLPARFNPFRYSPLTLLPGPHLAAGLSMKPVVQGQLRLAAQLCELPGLTAVGWLPARMLSGPGQFRRGISRWLESDVFPGFGLVALLPTPDHGMQSEGLAFFTGQELRVEPELAADGRAAARIALGLIHQLVERGAIEVPERAIGPAGEFLRLEPSPNGRFVRISGG
jgi:hypothetical protein